MSIYNKCSVVCAALLLTLQPFVWARIKLATLPQRERVEIQLDNGRYTLVEEERIVTLLKSTAQGNNLIDFAWSNTQIDKNSIQFRPLGISEGDKFRPIKKAKTAAGQEVDEVSVINVAYPPNENALVWEVYALEGCAVKVRVSYLIGNFNRIFSYRALANKDETLLTLKNFMKVQNYAGEDFGSAGVWAGFAERFEKWIGQQDEMLMLLQAFVDVPVKKTYLFDWYTYGQLNADKPFASRILMYYVLDNDKKNKMGLFPLQPGKARIFIQDGKGGEAFLGEDWARFTPIDDEMKLYLGEVQDVVCTRTIEKNERKTVRGNLFDQEIIVKYEIENFKDKPCTLRMLEQMNRIAQEYAGFSHGDVEWEKKIIGTSRDITFSYDDGGVLPVLQVELPARPKEKDKKVEKKIFRFHFTLKNMW